MEAPSVGPSTCVGFFGSFRGGTEARSDDLVARVVNLAFQHLETFQMSGLVGIDFGCAIQALRGFCKLAGAHIEIEQLQQRLAVIVFAIGRVIEFTEELKNLRRRSMRRRDVFHDGDELPALAAPPLELLQLAGEGDGSLVLLAVEKPPDQRDHLLHARRILLEQLPHQRFGFGKAARRHQRVGIGLAQSGSDLPGIQLRFENEDSCADLSLRKQALSVSQRDVLVGGIFLVGAFVPLRDIAALGLGDLCNLLKRSCGTLAIAQLRSQFRYS